MSASKRKLPLCPMCGNPVKSTDECQCGGPQPDGCILAQYGVRDKLREREAGDESAFSAKQGRMSMSKFRKKPIEIEAFQFTPEHTNTDPMVPMWFVDAVHAGAVHAYPDFIMIRTLEGEMKAAPGDWIIQGVKGEIYPCKPDIFAATYDEVVTRIEGVTIDQLERILQEPDTKVHIAPDGSVTRELT